MKDPSIWPSWKVSKEKWFNRQLWGSISRCLHQPDI